VTDQNGNFQLWGPNNGSNNGLPSASPSGGNFFAEACEGIGDNFAQTGGSIQQTLNNLVIGHWYSLSFYYAAGQEEGYTGRAFTLVWNVDFGGATFNTVALAPPGKGFQGWILYSNPSFQATSTTETLSFSASGQSKFAINPNPPPILIPGVYEAPFMLLDDVQVHDLVVPEIDPGSIGSACTFLFGGLALLKHRFRRKKLLAATTD
jgi:hypothetical protein